MALTINLPQNNTAWICDGRQADRPATDGMAISHEGKEALRVAAGSSADVMHGFTPVATAKADAAGAVTVILRGGGKSKDDSANFLCRATNRDASRIVSRYDEEVCYVLLESRQCYCAEGGA